MNWQYIWNAIPRFVDATLITLQLSFWAIVLSLLVGFFCAIVTTYKIRILHPIVKFYIELSRNTPLLIQTTIITCSVFLLAYILVFLLTSRSYRKIVTR